MAFNLHSFAIFFFSKFPQLYNSYVCMCVASKWIVMLLCFLAFKRKRKQTQKKNRTHFTCVRFIHRWLDVTQQLVFATFVGFLLFEHGKIYFFVVCHELRKLSMIEAGELLRSLWWNKVSGRLVKRLFQGLKI